MHELTGKVVLITGAANGIGAEFVRVLVEHGTKHVRILDIDEKAGVLLQNDINNVYGENKVKFTKCDISINDELFEAFKSVTEENGYIDIVVNNAAVTNESNSEYVRKEIEVNIPLTSPRTSTTGHRPLVICVTIALRANKEDMAYYATLARRVGIGYIPYANRLNTTALVNGTIKAIELMRKDKGGKGGTVINVSSVASLIKFSPLLFVYAATKSAVMQFSNCIGKEPYSLKTGVRVITICYGPTKTGIIDQMASFDEDIKIQDLVALYPMQTVKNAALGTLEAFKKGESGSTWLVNNGKPAKDITATVDKAYSDMAKLLEDD